MEQLFWEWMQIFIQHAQHRAASLFFDSAFRLATRRLTKTYERAQ